MTLFLALELDFLGTVGLLDRVGSLKLRQLNECFIHALDIGIFLKIDIESDHESAAGTLG